MVDRWFSTTFEIRDRLLDVGVGTRAALRSWQKARGLTADGYLSIEMIARLKNDASGPSPARPSCSRPCGAGKAATASRSTS